MPITPTHRDAMNAMRASNDAALMFLRVASERAGVHPTDLRALEHLATEGEMSAGDLASRLGLTSGATTALVNRLSRRGFIGRRRDSRDRRIALVSANRAQVSASLSSFADVMNDLQTLITRYDPHQVATIANWARDVGHTFRRHTARTERETLRTSPESSANSV